MIDYYGDGVAPESAEFQHYKVVTERIITEAAKKDIKVVLLYETQVQNNSTNQAADILNDLNSIISHTPWMNNRAYLHINNIPVICIFGIYQLRDNEWGTIKTAIGEKASETFKGILGAQKQPDSMIQTITESYGFTYQ